MRYDELQWLNIRDARKSLSLYWKAREREYKAKQSNLSGVEYSGMPKSPSPGNTEEAKLVKMTNDGYKYKKYQQLIINALNDVILVENETWYQLLHKRYIELKTPAEIQEELAVSSSYYNQKINEALLHFYDCCSCNYNIFYE